MKKVSLIHMGVFSVLLHGIIILAGWFVLKTFPPFEREESVLSVFTADIFTPEEEARSMSFQSEESGPDVAASLGSKQKKKKKAGRDVVKEFSRTGGEGVTGDWVGEDRLQVSDHKTSMEEMKPVSFSGRDEPVKTALPQSAPRAAEAPARQPDEKQIVSSIFGIVKKAVVYPPVARKNGMEGVVKVSFRIEKSGSPGDVQVAKSSGYDILDKAAIQAVMKGQAYPVITKLVIIPVRFTLK